jgi:hypothetical protein
VLCADEKTSIQARRHRHSTQPPGPGQRLRVEHEYDRQGAWAYLAAWDVRRAQLFALRTGLRPSTPEPVEQPSSCIVVHTPVHASWLYQIEIYFSVLTRKALKPNEFSSLNEFKTRKPALPVPLLAGR